MRHWSDEDVAQLRRLARSKMPYREIGDLLGRSANSIMHKIRDLGLPAQMKPSGYQPDRGRRADNGRFLARKEEEAKRAGKVTLPPLASLCDC